jgi:hypothetical protein
VEIDIVEDDVIRNIAQAYNTYGAISDFEVHPSGNYIVALSINGFIYVFDLESGEIRAKIAI